MADIDLNDIAIHEAAHGVVARRLGFYVGISFDGKTGKVVSYEDPHDPKALTIEELLDSAVVILAGPIVSAERTGRTLSEVLREEGAQDAVELGRILDAVPKGKRTQFRRRAERVARKMVKENLEAIQRVADRLASLPTMGRSIMTKTEIDHVIKRRGTAPAKPVSQPVERPEAVEEPETDAPVLGYMIFQARG